MSATASFCQWIAELVDGGEPISFYDAFVALRRARRLADVDAPALAALIALHDAAQSTDGARAALAEFLRGCAARRAAEERLAGRPITLADSGKTARAPVGGLLRLALDENAAVGFRWQVSAQSGGVYLERVGRDDGARALFQLRLARAGRARLVLDEERPAPIAAVAKEVAARHFELTVVVEGEPG